MFGQTLVFVCATLALVAGSCFESPVSQGLSQQIVSVQPSFSSPVTSLSVPVMSGVGLSNPVASVSSPMVSLGSPLISSGSVLSLSGSPLLSSSLTSGLGSGLGLGAQVTDGPQGTPVTVVEASPVTLPAVEGPVVTLSSQPIPAPRVLSQRYICTKTIVKPQVYQRTITVPKIQRYLKRAVTPVVENVSYKSTPVSQGSDIGSGVGSGVLSLSSGLSSAAFTGSAVSQGLVSSPVSVSSTPVAVSGSPSSCFC